MEDLWYAKSSIERPLKCLHMYRPGAQGCGAGSSSERTRTAITAALRKKLKDLMGEFQDLRQRLQDEYRRAPKPYLPKALDHGSRSALRAQYRDLMK